MFSKLIARLLPKYNSNETSNTAARLRQDRRNQRSKSIRHAVPPGREERVRLCQGNKQASISERLGSMGRSIILDGTSDGTNSVLGRSTDKTPLLLGHTPNLIVRPSTGLFIPSFCDGVVSDAQDTAGKDTSMVVTVVDDKSMREQLVARLDGIEAIRVSNYLHYVFDCSDEPVSVNGVYASIVLLKQTFPGFERLKASDVGPLKFYGGPPNKYGWYYGSLLTLLLDKILCAYVTGHKNVVGRFLNVNI